MDERDYLWEGFPQRFRNPYVMPPLNFDPTPPVIIPTVGAAKYWYVEPKVQPRAVLPDTRTNPEGIGLLPANALNILLRQTLGRAPRLADDRRDLLKDADETFYGGGQAPVPTPTPTPTKVKKGVSYAS